MEEVRNFNNQSLGEEISNAISHGVGALLSIAGTVVLIVRAAMMGRAIGVVSAALYGASLILLYTFSSLYHSLTHRGAKRVFQVFDHCSIFVLILGTYIPICLTLLGGWVGWTIFGVIAACAVVGIVFNSVNLARWHRLSLVLYVIMGWMIVIAMKPVLQAVPLKSLWLLAGGGLMYTAGIVFYRSGRHRYWHFIWHLFVLAGSILHYFFILFYVYPLG